MSNARNFLAVCLAVLAIALSPLQLRAAESPNSDSSTEAKGLGHPNAADESDPLNEANVLRDPEVPVLGNPQGDVTIVQYFDYQCPYCRKFNPDLAKVVHDDGHIRLVFKDWPVFGGISVDTAKLALAAKYQDKFAQAHDALIALKKKLTEEAARAALTQAGVDVERAKQDLAAHRQEIEAILARNADQATAFGFRGTPSFIIGHFRVAGVLDAAMFKRAVADARAAARKKNDPNP